MLADTRRELSTALGILHRDEGVPLRATFTVDPAPIPLCAAPAVRPSSATMRGMRFDTGGSPWI